MSPEIEPTDEQIEQATTSLIAAAVKPLQSNPALRDRLIEAKKRAELTIDDVSKDEVQEAGFSVEARERAQQITSSFEAFIREHKDEITALPVLLQPAIREATDLCRHQDAGRDHRQATTVLDAGELWQAYQTLDKSKVRGSGRARADRHRLVGALRHPAGHGTGAVQGRVEARFNDWLAQQEQLGRRSRRSNANGWR